MDKNTEASMKLSGIAIELCATGKFPTRREAAAEAARRNPALASLEQAGFTAFCRAGQKKAATLQTAYGQLRALAGELRTREPGLMEAEAVVRIAEKHPGLYERARAEGWTS